MCKIEMEDNGKTEDHHRKDTRPLSALESDDSGEEEEDSEDELKKKIRRRFRRKS